MSKLAYDRVSYGCRRAVVQRRAGKNRSSAMQRRAGEHALGPASDVADIQ
ncbi:hypothetical protein [Alicyclobacillus mengziensis]|uniref:Uncharacterized protein n=1 Tax=Alicyclobacillus mengziensis TaxID=2931921 RepID=A0A9X7VZW6_9BACL|nr:hypothetical protein [Alicyclobacillus mengziensis]QSO48111.1 hypothetical protein JZ786_03615 [Alicyclobacillus mengziensis]